MSTATMDPQTRKNNLASPLAPEDGWQTLEAPEMVKFDKAGETIAGVLIAVTSVRVNNKDVTEFMLGLGQKRMKLLGTYDLLQKLTRAHVGCSVRIKYRGENPDVSRNGNSLKVFDVQIKGTPSRSSDSSPITDEDIPF
jgi:hypothetical protein